MLHPTLIGSLLLVLSSCHQNAQQHVLSDVEPRCQPDASYSVVPECERDCVQAAARRGYTWSQREIARQCRTNCTVTTYLADKAALKRQVALLSARVAVHGKLASIETPGGPQAAIGLGLEMESGDKLWLLRCDNSSDMEKGEDIIAVGRPVDSTSVQLRWGGDRQKGKNVLLGDQIGLADCVLMRP